MAFEARMKSGIPVTWRVAEHEEYVDNPEGKQKVKKGQVIITRTPDDSWPKSMAEFETQYNVKQDGTATSKGGGNWYRFIWDTKGGSNSHVKWGPNTSYINADGDEKWPRAKKQFDMYYERKTEAPPGMSFHSENKKM